MKQIQVLGPGCPKCQELYRRCQAALYRLGIDAELTKVEDINQIIDLGVMLTPGLVIDGKVVVSGKVPSADELVELIQK